MRIQFMGFFFWERIYRIKRDLTTVFPIENKRLKKQTLIIAIFSLATHLKIRNERNKQHHQLSIFSKILYFNYAVFLL